ncbi:MAG TPA: hypothetical protein V6D05_10370 [Stenomitos sp.]
MSAPLSRRQRYRLTIAATVAAIGVSAFLFVQPQIADYQAKLVELEQARSALPAERVFNPSYAALSAKLELLKTQLATMRRSFPVAENVSAFLLELESLASNQVAISHFYPTKLAPLKLPTKQRKSGISVSEQQIELDADGPFPALHQLLAKFEDNAYPLGVHSIQMERAPREVAVVAGGGPLTGAPPAERLRLKIKMSAYLLDKPLPDTPLFGDGLAQQMASDQTTMGVADPFVSLVPDLPPIAATASLPPIASVPPAAPPSVPSPPVRKPVSGLEGWRLEGILYGPGDMAIVRKEGRLSMTVRVGDELDGWRITQIKPTTVLLAKGTQRERLSLPDGLL